MREEAEAEADTLLGEEERWTYWGVLARPVLAGLLLARDRGGLQNHHVFDWARARDAGPALEASADDPQLRLFIDTTLQAPAEELSGMWAVVNAAVRRLPGT